jgi:hypothetical protein
VVLIDFLRANADIFAWSPSDMPGIPSEVAEHSLDILPHSRAVEQRLHRFDEERRCAIGEELRKLLEAGFIKEVFHPTWLANPVLVKKKNGKWRMCVDYTSFNKACSKIPFPLPRIDQIVDSTAGSELLCFLDACSGYHQIKMKESDQLGDLIHHAVRDVLLRDDVVRSPKRGRNILAMYAARLRRSHRANR